MVETLTKDIPHTKSSFPVIQGQHWTLQKVFISSSGLILGLNHTLKTIPYNLGYGIKTTKGNKVLCFILNTGITAVT